MSKSVLEVVISSDARPLEAGMRRAGLATDRFEKQSAASSKRVGGHFSSMAKGAGLFGGAIVASGAVGALKDIVSAAQAAEVSQRGLAAQLKANGIHWSAHSAEIDKVISRVSNLAAVDDEDLQDALKNVVRGTGNLNQSLKLMGTVADVARSKHMDLATAGTLVAKVADGNVRVLKSLGIAYTPVTTAVDALKEKTGNASKSQLEHAKAVDKATNAHRALALLQKATGGQAETYGKTSAGQMDRFKVSIENLKEEMGKGLLPLLGKAAKALTDLMEGFKKGKGAGKQVREVVESVGDLYTGLGKVLKASGFFEYAGKQAKRMASLVSASAKTISTVIETVTDLLHGRWSEAWSGAKRAVSSMVKGALAMLGLFFAPLALIGKKLASVFGGIPKIVVGQAGRMISAGATLAKNLITGLIKEIGHQAGNVGSAIAGVIPGGVRIPGITGKRAGGKIGRYADGGLVPAMVSPGEMLVGPDGSASMVPGARVAADSVFTALPVGTAVITGHGQGLLAAGASLDDALAMQMPHFAVGGIVGAAAAARKAGLSGAPLVTATAIAGPESGYNPRARLNNPPIEDSRGLWQINTIAHPWSRSKNLYDPSVNAEAMMTVSNGGRNWGPWAGYTSGNYRNYLDRARKAVIASRNITDPGTAGSPAQYKNIFGERYSESARNAGFSQGLSGRSRLDPALVGEIAAGAIAKRTKVKDAVAAEAPTYSALASSGGSGGGGASGGASISKTGLSGHPELKDKISRIARTVMSKFPGLSITSTTGGTHVKGSYHYSGRAVDIGGPQRTMDSAGSWIQKNMAGSLAEGIHNSTLAVDNGRRVNGASTFSSVWGGHRDHVHLAARKGGIARFAKGGLAGFTGPVLSAGKTDSHAVMVALAALAEKLADASSVAYGTLTRVIAKADAAAASARKAGDKLGGRRNDTIADLARAQQGLRLGNTIFGAKRTSEEIARRETLSGYGQIVRGVDPSSAAGQTELLGGAQQAQGILQQQRAALRKSLRRAQATGNRDIIDQTLEALRAVDDALAERRAGIVTLKKGIATANAEEALTRKEEAHSRLVEPFQNRLSKAALGNLRASVDNPGDLRVQMQGLQESLHAATEAYRAAVAAGDPEAISEFASAILSLKDAIESNTSAQLATDDALRLTARNAQFSPYENGLTAEAAVYMRTQVETPDFTADDKASLERSLKLAEAGYAQAVLSSDPEAINEFGAAVLSLRASLKSLEEATSENTNALAEAMNSLAEEVKKQNQFAQSVVAVTGAQLAGAVASLMNGEIVGTGLRGRNATAGAGSVVRM